MPQLPDEIGQQLGWSPLPQIPDVTAPVQAPAPEVVPPVAGQPPSATPVDVPAQLPTAPDASAGMAVPPPTQLPALPSAQAELATPIPADTTSPAHPDFKVPASAIGGGGTGAPQKPQATPAVAKPQSIDQRFAGQQQQQQQADQASMAAIADQEAVSRAKAAADLAAFNAHDTKAADIEKQRAAQQAERDKTIAEKQAYVDSTLKDVDNYKVDQNKYWNDAGVGTHIGWYIAMALAGVGDALQHKSGPNPVIQMLQEKMHQSVVAQMDQREQLKEKNARAEHAFDKYDQFSKDKQAQINLLDAQNDKALANALTTAAAKYADPQAVANAHAQAAQLMQSSSEKALKATETAANYDMQKKQLAVAQANVGVAAGHLQLARDQEKRAAAFQEWEKGFKEQELGIKMADEARKAMADKKKVVKETGVGNPQTGDYLLNGQGRAMMQQADQLEVANRNNPTAAASAYLRDLRSQATTPDAKAKVGQLEQTIQSDPKTAQSLGQGYIDSLRDKAKTEEVVTITDPTERREVMSTVDYANRVVQTAAKMKEMLAGDPSMFDRDAWAKFKVEFGSNTANMIKVFGANPSSREFEAWSKHIMDFDPSSWLSRAVNKGPALAALDGAEGMAKSGVNSYLFSHGIKDGWTPTSPLETPAASLGSGQTSVEAGDAATPGALSLRSPAAPIAQREAENAPGTGDTGLDKRDDATVKSLISRADRAPNAERARIVQQLAAPIAANNRPSLANGILGVVRAQDPSLYEEVLKALPKMQADEIRKLDSATRSFPGLPGPQAGSP